MNAGKEPNEKWVLEVDLKVEDNLQTKTLDYPRVVADNIKIPDSFLPNCESSFGFTHETRKTCGSINSTIIVKYRAQRVEF